MKIPCRAILVSISLFLVLSAMLLTRGDVSAAGEPPTGPDRYAVVTEDYLQYVWWLVKWSDGTVGCQAEIEHPGLPNGGDIYDACGESLYQKFLDTPPCEVSSTDPEACPGYYLHYVSSKSATRQVPAQLPPPVVWVTLDGCVPYQSSHRCGGDPTLVLTGEEPLTGYSITKLEGWVEDKPFVCDPTCQVDLGPTDEDGIHIQFWAYSSYGDSSVMFDAQVRVRTSGEPQDTSLYVDVISSRWRGDEQAPCMQTWNLFPPVGGLGSWLSSPDRVEELASNQPFDYLAGNLIAHGIVSAAECADGGMLDNGYASTCGMEAARSAVEEWQNRFDVLIYNAAQDVGVPAQLLKNIFSRESQFWPGSTPGRPEAGFGQMTMDGADTIFLWEASFYEQFCSTVLDPEICASKAYPDLQPDWDDLELSALQRSQLQAALVDTVDATCPECELGIDLQKADRSIPIFAEMLRAECKQTGMIVDLNYANSSFKPAYEDMWRFTLVNYNAGSGCLGLAINETSRMGEALDWQHVASHLTPACHGALDYVNEITSMP
jgi:hypothetical protein